MNLEDLVLFQRFQITGYTENPKFKKDGLKDEPDVNSSSTYVRITRNYSS